jgi:hypothetical protein
VGVSGIPFIQRNRIGVYALAGLAIFLLYSPHLPIFFHQLSKGGVGGEDGWLGAPPSDFLWQYIRYIFHFSWLLMGIILLLIIAGFWFRNPELEKKRKFFYLSFIWFLIPFLVGYFYSINVNPVLQYSVLIFSFPFLFFILFGHIKEVNLKWKAVILIVLTPVILLSLIIDREYYTLFYNSPYIGIVEDTQQFQSVNTSNKDVSIIETNAKITDYYVDKYTDGFPFYTGKEFPKRKDLLFFLQNEKLNTLSFGYTTLADAMLPSIMYDYLPILTKRVDFSQGNFYAFSANKKEDVKMGRTEMYRTISFLNSFDEEMEFWKVKASSLSILDTISNETIFEFKKGQEWGISFEIDMDELEIQENDLIDIRLDIKTWSPEDELIIVSEIYYKENKYDWRASSNNEFKTSIDGDDYRMYHTIKLSDLNLPSTKKLLKIYCWNKGKTKIKVDNFSIKTRIGNPIVYGLLKEIK